MKNAKKDKITPAMKKFSIEYASTNNGIESIRRAYPDVASKSSDAYLAVKANRLLKKDNVITEVEYQKNRLNMLASKAIDKVDKLLDSDNEAIASNNAWRVIEQSLGKAITRVESTNLNVTLEDALKLLK